jgi:hypothetical protein
MAGNILSIGVGVAAMLFVAWMVARPNNPLWDAHKVWLASWGLGRGYSIVWLTGLAIVGLALILAGLAGLIANAT